MKLKPTYLAHQTQNSNGIGYVEGSFSYDNWTPPTEIKEVPSAIQRVPSTAVPANKMTNQERKQWNKQGHKKRAAETQRIMVDTPKAAPVPIPPEFQRLVDEAPPQLSKEEQESLNKELKKMAAGGGVPF